MLSAPESLLDILPGAPRRLEVRSSPSSLIFRARLPREGLLVSFTIGGGRVTGTKVASGKGTGKVDNPADDAELVELWNRVQWVTGIATRTLWPAYEPSQKERELAELFLRLDARDTGLPAPTPLFEAFDRGEWQLACALAESESVAPWFETVRLALSGHVGNLLDSVDNAEELLGHMASFRGVARRELRLLDAALVDLKRATANLTFAERANHYTMIAVISHLLDRDEEAVDLVAWAVEHASDDIAFVRCIKLLLRFGGYGPADAALARRTNGTSAPAKVWLLRAKLALWCGQPSRAREFAANARDGDPHQIALTLGIAATLEGDEDAALTLFESIEAARDREAHSWSAELLHRRGEQERACVHLELAGLTSQGPVHTLLRSVVYDEVVGRSGSAQLAALGWTDPAEHTIQLAAEALVLFQGNRGPRPSRTPTAAPVESAHELLPVPTPPGDMLNTSRLASSGILKEIRHRPVSEIHAAFGELQNRYPHSPHPYCYWGELLLWEGRYDEAFEAFQANKAARAARWGYVGRAAVHVHHKRFTEALNEFETMASIYDSVPGATTHVYLGELYRIRGEYERALHELRVAVEAKPLRLGARINMILCYAAQGDNEAARQEYKALTNRWPNVFWHARRALGIGDTPLGSSMVDVCHQTLTLMRGNRSSHLHTFYDTAGELRFTFDTKLWESLTEARSFLRIGALEQLVLGATD